MGAPAHFTQIKTARELWEPVHKSLYEISWILPEAINDRDPLLLLENAKSLGGIDVTKEIKNHASSFIEYSTAGYTARLQRNFNFGENVNTVDLCPPPLLILPLSRTLHGILYAFQQYEKVFGDSSHGIGASYVMKYLSQIKIPVNNYVNEVKD